MYYFEILFIMVLNKVKGEANNARQTKGQFLKQLFEDLSYLSTNKGKIISNLLNEVR